MPEYCASKWCSRGARTPPQHILQSVLINLYCLFCVREAKSNIGGERRHVPARALTQTIIKYLQQQQNSNDRGVRICLVQIELIERWLPFDSPLTMAQTSSALVVPLCFNVWIPNTLNVRYKLDLACFNFNMTVIEFQILTVCINRLSSVYWISIVKLTHFRLNKLVLYAGRSI